MTTTADAWAAIRARLQDTGSSITIPMYWPNEKINLPNTPTAFAFISFDVTSSFLASFGGGRANNRYRNDAFVTAYVFVPNGEGMEVAMDHAETIAAQLRSYRDDDVSCFEARVEPGGPGSDISPPGLRTEVGNYYYAVAEASLFFDQIG